MKRSAGQELQTTNRKCRSKSTISIGHPHHLQNLENLGGLNFLKREISNGRIERSDSEMTQYTIYINLGTCPAIFALILPPSLEGGQFKL